MSKQHIEIIIFETLPSTSLYLKERIAETLFQAPMLCRTKLQTAGYGQFGRKWHTKDENLTFSLAIPCPEISDELPFKIILPIFEFLQKFEDALFLKWPNDIHTSLGKLCGVITEVIKDSAGQKVMIIGIGINTSKQSILNCDSDFINIDDHNKAAEEIAHSIMDSVNDQKTCMSQLIEKWFSADYFKFDEQIFVLKEGRIQPAIYQGITNKGFVSVIIEGQKKEFASGRVSLRRKEKL